MKYGRLALALLLAGTAGAAESAFEKEAKQLRDQRDKAVAAAVDPINKRYQQALEQVIRRAAQAKDQPAVDKLKEELGNVGANLVSAAQSTKLQDRVRRTRWTMNLNQSKQPQKDSWMQLEPDGQVTLGWNAAPATGAWSVTSENTITVQWQGLSNNETHVMTFDRGMRSAQYARGTEPTATKWEVKRLK
jgi:hypothetical protein